MGNIYLNAQDVVVWLDLHEAEEKGLQDIREKTAGPLRTEQIRDVEIQDPYKPTFTHLKAAIGNESLAAVVPIFLHKYWERIWAVQEIRLARALWIITRRIP